MNDRIRRWSTVGLFLGALALAGCGQQELPKDTAYPVKGRLMWKGEPVRFVQVHFEPKGGKGGPADGKTDENGNFELRTYSNTQYDGALPGEYEITIENCNPVKMGAIPEGFEPTTVPPELQKLARTIEIEAGDNELGDINLD